MRRVFADSHYWIALANQADPDHDKAAGASRELGAVSIVTTEEVLVEFVSYFCKGGASWRRKVADLVDAMRRNCHVKVVGQSTMSFRDGLKFFRSRPDKEYSLPDCVSMVTMRLQDISEVLTSDRHFEQEGFRRLY